MKILDPVIQIGTPFALLLAQSVPIAGDGNLWLEIGKEFGVLAVLVWYLWYNTTLALPKILESAAKEREALSQIHKQELDAKRHDYTDALVQQREMLNTSLVNTTEAFKATIDRIACKFEKDDLPCQRKS